MHKGAKKQEGVNIKFECRADEASAVFLAGSFNNWSESATPMTRGKNGIWSASLGLPRGRYEYKFIIDGEWCCSPELLPDPSDTSCVPNTLGTMNFAVDAGADEA